MTEKELAKDLVAKWDSTDDLESMVRLWLRVVVTQVQRVERERIAQVLQKWADDEPAFPYQNPADVVSHCARFVRGMGDEEP